MYKTRDQLNTIKKPNNEGKTRMLMTHLADFDKANPKIKLYSLVQLQPGEEVQYHMHVGESELYFIMSGHGVYNDNGAMVEVTPGMSTLTPSGEGHALKNTGNEELTFIALILED